MSKLSDGNSAGKESNLKTPTYKPISIIKIVPLTFYLKFDKTQNWT
jgi:hypothetical protein